MGSSADEKGIENKIFIETFLGLKIAGFWKSTTSKSRLLLLCYQFFTFISYTSIFNLISVTVIDIIVSEEKNFANIIEYWYMIAQYFNILVKCGNVMVNRNRIINILRSSVLNERWTNLRDDEEMAMVKMSQTGEQNILRLWMSFQVTNAIGNALNPVISKNPNNDLMWECWSPCDRHVPSCFWICYFYQVFGYVMCSVGHGSSDCIIFNFIERLCTHVQILQYRLKLLPELVEEGVINTAESELRYVKECVLDHQNIYEAATEVRSAFTVAVFVHFLVSFTVLCTNIYFLSKQPLFSSTFIAVFIYLCGVMVQNFFYCWYGYKFTEMNSEIPYTIFATDWMKLREETRKSLRSIMIFSTKSISLFDNFIVELSPEMFLKMLKISYSAFNILQTQNSKSKD